jgi:hypothetical protein
MVWHHRIAHGAAAIMMVLDHRDVLVFFCLLAQLDLTMDRRVI